MRAEIIAIGDEIITGQRLDTNTQWLAERLTELGVDVAFHSTIGDHLADNVAVFRTAIDRVDVVVATGGLGPTADDLTRQSIAAAVGVDLVRDEASLTAIRQLFERRGRQMPERNAVQADFPAGASAIPNEHGTAPGIALRVVRAERGPCDVFAVPGVPAEMKPMWQQTVVPAIVAARGEARVIRHRRIKCFGVGESQLEAMLPDLIRRGREPSVGITVSDATITLRITAAGPDDAACFAAMEPTAATIYELLGTIAYGEEEDELESVDARLLAGQQQTVSVAEWATGGLVSEWLARAAPEQSVLAGGFVIGGLRQLEQLTGDTALRDAAPCSSAVATAAAEWVRRACEADFGIGVAAFPAASDGPDAKVYISIATPDRVRRLQFGCASHPAIRQSRTAKQALNALRLILLGNEPDPIG
ncbi:CinA family nicotinamide mononucleotide deamidase-related protein [Lacipirellula limnantheis]|uniref:CinA-like protein n=1 Tax=Lacipirellula limnantheis TaxID=2528024 RepID=A0A517TWW7_9BACT|nr:CinA family nicotinamide mononucleotide deamidase-related protein [Lacipirellula limnantheis]QDT72860.1 Putative competence-damage inducible protein [Lacipirellula limnantheis]